VDNADDHLGWRRGQRDERGTSRSASVAGRETPVRPQTKAPSPPMRCRSETLIGTCDSAPLALGLASAFRRSELAARQVDDLAGWTARAPGRAPPPPSLAGSTRRVGPHVLAASNLPAPTVTAAAR
jgi:hypothetical protein